MNAALVEKTSEVIPNANVLINLFYLSLAIPRF
jgi:hypothetical protein